MKTDKESITTNTMANVSANPMATGGTVSAPVHGGAPVVHVESDKVRALEKKVNELSDEAIYLRMLLEDALAELDRVRGENK